MSHHVEAERRELVQTLTSAGPNAPTLCTGWDTRMLLAHLVRRERSVLELGARIRLPLVGGAAEESTRHYAETHDFAEMLATFAGGAPLYSPFAFPPTQEAFNLLEYVIHHEDVRRATAQSPEVASSQEEAVGPREEAVGPRELDPGRERAVLRRLRSFAPLTLRSAPVRVEFQTPDGQRLSAGRGSETVTVTGAPVELALVAFGRQRVARVDYSGSEEAVAALTSAKLGT